MEKPPIVSILMTAYNREAFIEKSRNCIINSTFDNWELIIVDNQNTDQTVKIANHYTSTDSRIKVFINDNNLGDYPNRNKAASYASGKYKVC